MDHISFHREGEDGISAFSEDNLLAGEHLDALLQALNDPLTKSIVEPMIDSYLDDARKASTKLSSET